jgi:hypothetical protein
MTLQCFFVHNSAGEEKRVKFFEVFADLISTFPQKNINNANDIKEYNCTKSHFELKLNEINCFFVKGNLMVSDSP